jgi:hypothetical protein
MFQVEGPAQESFCNGAKGSCGMGAFVRESPSNYAEADPSRVEDRRSLWLGAGQRHHMKRKIISGKILFWLRPLAVIALFAILCDQSLPGGKPAVKVAEEEAWTGIRKELQRLQNRVILLEKRVETLEAVVRSQSRDILGLKPGQEGIPPGAKPFEFNGTTYYVVPLDTSEPRP